MIKVIEKDYLQDDFINKQFINNINIKDKITFSKDDIYYFGNYDEDKIKLIKKKLLSNKKSIIRAIKNDVKFIICGNSFDMFNNHFNTKDLNIYTSYNKKAFIKIKKLLIRKHYKDNIINKIDNLDMVSDTNNFRYKNTYCLSNYKLINKIIKKTK